MAKQIFKYSVGCDISKDTFNVCILEVDQEMESKVKASHKFNNETKGFKEFESWVKKHKRHDVQTGFYMEATGVYYENLAWYLFEQEYNVYVLLPYKTKHYLKSIGISPHGSRTEAQSMEAAFKIDLYLTRIDASA